MSSLLVMILLLTVKQLYLTVISHITVTILFLAEGTQASAASPQSTEADDRAHPEDHPQAGMYDLLGRLSVASNRYVSLFLLLKYR